MHVTNPIADRENDQGENRREEQEREERPGQDPEDRFDNDSAVMRQHPSRRSANQAWGAIKMSTIC